jgi:hypothetical protein
MWIASDVLQLDRARRLQRVAGEHREDCERTNEELPKSGRRKLSAQIGALPKSTVTRLPLSIDRKT